MTSRVPLTDTPWYWACLFTSMALALLWAMDAKYDVRQLAVEQKGQGRMRAAERMSGGEMTTKVSREGDLNVSLKPLYAIFAAVLIVCWGLLWWTHIRVPRSNPKDPFGESHRRERSL